MRRSLVLFSSSIIKLSCRKSHALARSAPSRLRDPAKTRARPVGPGTAPAPAALVSGGLDFDHSRHRGSRRGDPHLEHAVRVLRLHLSAVDALGEREAPLEPTVRDLADEIVLVRSVRPGLALAFDGEDVVHPGHRDVLRIHAWQGELDDIGAVLDPPLRGGEPRRRALDGLIRDAIGEPQQQVIDVMVKVELPGWRPAKHGVHRAPPSGQYVVRYLSCSILTSLPEYVPTRIRSPAYTSLRGCLGIPPSTPLDFLR